MSQRRVVAAFSITYIMRIVSLQIVQWRRISVSDMHIQPKSITRSHQIVSAQMIRTVKISARMIWAVGLYMHCGDAAKQ